MGIDRSGVGGGESGDRQEWGTRERSVVEEGESGIDRWGGVGWGESGDRQEGECGGRGREWGKTGGGEGWGREWG